MSQPVQPLLSTNLGSKSQEESGMPSPWTKETKNLWQQAIQTDLKKLTDYKTLIVLDSGEDIPKGYQKIPYHIVFDVKYELRHKARLVAGGN
jgi:hypothetical protein